MSLYVSYINERMYVCITFTKFVKAYIHTYTHTYIPASKGRSRGAPTCRHPQKHEL